MAKLEVGKVEDAQLVSNITSKELRNSLAESLGENQANVLLQRVEQQKIQSANQRSV